uniref:Uncharacterized protein n=1 Tax=Phenylobacterium glaciei TaxID=2803784 RepID=A0A974P3A4_9CAUL|nr:hypothetical protein JKL49_24890 [Phenylobacterium glaciei]
MRHYVGQSEELARSGENPCCTICGRAGSWDTSPTRCSPAPGICDRIPTSPSAASRPCCTTSPVARAKAARRIRCLTQAGTPTATATPRPWARALWPTS